MIEPTAPFEAAGWQFIPGAPHLTAPIQTTDCHDVVEHPVAAVIESVRRYPGMQDLGYGSEGTAWRGRLEGEGFRLELIVRPWFGQVWGSVELDGRCAVGHLLALWAHLLAEHSGVWLFRADVEPDLVYPPASFIERFARSPGDTQSAAGSKVSSTSASETGRRSAPE